MKELMKHLFNGRSVAKKKRIIEEGKSASEEMFDGFDVKELIELIDTEFKNKNGGYSTSTALNIVTKLDNLRQSLSFYSGEIQSLFITLTEEVEYSEKLNAEDAQKLKQQREALRLEARYDWYGKFRTFLFSVMGAALFIVTLFTIGYIEKNYDWAVLPLAKYVEVSSEKLNDTHQVSELKLTNLGTESPAVVEKLGKPIDKAISGNE